MSRFRDDYPLASPATRQAYLRARAAWEREVSQVQSALIRFEAPWRELLAPGNATGFERRGGRGVREAGGGANGERGKTGFRMRSKPTAGSRRRSGKRSSIRRRGRSARSCSRGWITRCDRRPLSFPRRVGSMKPARPRHQPICCAAVTSPLAGPRSRRHFRPCSQRTKRMREPGRRRRRIRAGAAVRSRTG